MRLIFVGGCERSGTTLVQRLLLAHSRIAGGPELIFTGRIAELYRQMAADLPGPYAMRRSAYYSDTAELAAAFRSFYRTFFERQCRSKPQARFFSEKTPSNIFAAPQLLEIFPDSFFVHVLRDGRDVLASHRDVEKRLAASGQDSYHHANFNRRRICGRWNRAVSIHRELWADGELDGRVIEVRFEELLVEPAKVLEQLFASLSLELEAATLNPEKLPARHGGIAPDGYWTTEEQLRQPFDPDKIQRWQHSLPLTDRVLANLFMAGPLQRLGYPVSPFYVHAHRTLAVLRKRQPSN